MLRSLALLILSSVLWACAGTPPSAPGTVDDDALQEALTTLLCRLEPACARLQLAVLDRRSTQAEIHPDGRLHVHLGLLLACRDEAEIAFVLAHELAHRALRHRLPRGHDERLRLELAADAWALRALAANGWRTDAPADLLHRLRSEPLGATSDRHRTALAQLDARIAALPARGEGEPAHDPRWQELLARWHD